MEVYKVISSVSLSEPNIRKGIVTSTKSCKGYEDTKDGVVNPNIPTGWTDYPKPMLHFISNDDFLRIIEDCESKDGHLSKVRMYMYTRNSKSIKLLKKKLKVKILQFMEEHIRDLSLQFSKFYMAYLKAGE